MLGTGRGRPLGDQGRFLPVLEELLCSLPGVGSSCAGGGAIGHASGLSHRTRNEVRYRLLGSLVSVFTRASRLLPLVAVLMVFGVPAASRAQWVVEPPPDCRDAILPNLPPATQDA